MEPIYSHIGLDQPAIYEIKIQGRLGHAGSATDWLSDWFLDEACIAPEANEQGEPITIITGTIADQAALHGLLAHIRDLGMTLLYVDCLSGHI